MNAAVMNNKEKIEFDLHIQCSTEELDVLHDMVHSLSEANMRSDMLKNVATSIRLALEAQYSHLRD